MHAIIYGTVSGERDILSGWVIIKTSSMKVYANKMDCIFMTETYCFGFNPNSVKWKGSSWKVLNLREKIFKRVKIFAPDTCLNYLSAERIWWGDISSRSLVNRILLSVLAVCRASEWCCVRSCDLIASKPDIRRFSAGASIKSASLRVHIKNKPALNELSANMIRFWCRNDRWIFNARQVQKGRTINFKVVYSRSRRDQIKKSSKDYAPEN